MGRAPCTSKAGLNKGPWTAMEDKTLTDYIEAHGEGQWTNLPKKSRCGKSCRLRWFNYLRPSIKRGNITPEEDDLIVRLHKLLGNRWSLIAGRLPGRTDNEIKNYWNSNLSKKLQKNPTNSSLKKHLPSSSFTEKNQTPSFDQPNIIPKASSENVGSQPYLSRPRASKCSKVDIQETPHPYMSPIVAGEQPENPLEFMADFEMEENPMMANFLDCEFWKLDDDFDYYNVGLGQEYKSFPSDNPAAYSTPNSDSFQSFVISETENQVQQHGSDCQRRPMTPLLTSSELDWF